MSAKVKLISFISAFVLVLGIMIIGVLSAEQVKVNIGGSVSFNATNVYAKVSGNISRAKTGNKTFSTLTYSAEETTGNESDWTNLALEFTETPDPIVITITVENLSTQRTLTVNLENTLQGEGLDIAVTRDSGSYTSGANVELPVSTGDGSSTTTFTLTLTVANPDEDLTNVTFGYILNLFDENYTPPPTPASSFTFSYNDADHTASITDFIGSETEVIIPSTVEHNGTTYRVTRIGDYAFFGCNSLTSVNFGENSQLTGIGERAFYSCDNLASITIPENVTSIGDWAFAGCYALAEVYNYSNVTTNLPSYAKIIYNASDLSSGKPKTRITVANNVQYYDYGDDYIALAPAVARGTLTEVTLGNRTTEINQYAFSSCDSLTSITIPSSVTSIGDNAFRNCKSLTSVGFRDNSQLTSIGSSAFYGCRGLTSITIPESVTSIGGDAFYQCSSLNEVTVESDNIYLALISQSACGYLINFVKYTGETVKVLKSVVDSVDRDFTKNTYLNGSNFTRSVSEDGQYYVYTRK